MQSPAGTIRLHASRTSTAAPLPAAGGGPSVVHSVHRSVLNLSTPEGLLVIASEEAGGLPNGILVPRGPDFRALRLAPGDDVALEAGAIRVGRALVVDLAAAVAWSPVLPATARPSETAARWRHRSARAHRLALSYGDARGLAALPGAVTALHAVTRAIAARDRSAATRSARPLVGLGPGLTPSGDDALAGVEAALRAVSHSLAGFVAGILADVDERTTTVSAMLLRHAARGEFAERVHRLLAALLGDDDAGLEDAVAQATAWGATSGTDGVAGVLCGLDAATGTIARAGAAA